MTLQLNDIRKSFGVIEVIKGVSLHVEPGEFVAFVGPSGCGKSTMLRMIAGLESITSGQMMIEGEDVTYLLPSQRGIAMVFQSYALYPHLSVYDNIAFSLRIAKLSKADVDQKVKAAAQSLQLTDYLDRLPKALSGGQRQRVAIGRAIVRNPKVFLFDEPLSNLDAALRTQMRVELAELHKKLDTTMVYVTHDQVEAMTLANRIVVMNQGRVEQVGTPIELYLTPQTPFVAGFIGNPKMNFITGSLAETLGADLVGIRPEAIEIVSKQPESTEHIHSEATITHIEKLGADTLIYTQSDKLGSLLVRHPKLLSAETGQTIDVSFAHTDLHCFKNDIRL